VYLAIAIFVFCLAGVFYVSPIAEVTDADMERQAQSTHSKLSEKPFRKQYTLFHAAFAEFCYTGSQVAIAGFFINYITETRSNTSSALGAKFLAGAQGCFAVGRFSGSFLMRFIRPRYVFLAYISSVIIFNAAAITQRQNTGLVMLMMTLFFESVCFPAIVALGIRGLGSHTKRGAGWIIGGVVGGACVPPLLGKTADLHNSTAFAMVVPVCFFVAAWSYALCVNFVPVYRDAADMIGDSDVGLTNDSVESSAGMDKEISK
jgi:MFS transporter, FHS family, L-fucose permease